MIDRLPPHDTTIEDAVIGCLLLGADINQVTLSPEDFYTERDGLIYKACQSLSQQDITLNQLTVAHELNRQGNLTICGGVAYLSHIISIASNPFDLPYYAETVSKLATARKLISTGEQIVSLGYENNDINEALSKADNLLLEIRKKSKTVDIITPEDRANLIAERYTQLYEQEGGIALNTGLTNLDKWLGGGFYDGDLIIVGARPGMGKTSFLQSIANYISQSKKVLIFSAEMSWQALTDRDIAGIVGITTNQVRLGGYDEDTWRKLIEIGTETIKKRQIYLYDHTPITTASILQASLAMKLRYGLDIIFVDYLGILDDREGENQNIRLGNISRNLKLAARKLEVPIVIAHQLSRALEVRENKEPKLQDLRESGHLEEDADTVLFLYRDSYYQDTEDNTTLVYIAKQRQGESNKGVKVYYDRKHQKYCDLVRID